MGQRLKYRWHPCKHCYSFLEMHGELTCVFMPTTFEGMNHEEYLRAVFAADGEPVLEETPRYIWESKQIPSVADRAEFHRAIVNRMLEHYHVNKKRPKSMRNIFGALID